MSKGADRFEEAKTLAEDARYWATREKEYKEQLYRKGKNGCIRFVGVSFSFSIVTRSVSIPGDR